MARFPHILVVDKDPKVRSTLEPFLNDEGYAVSSVSAFADALDELRQRPYQIVILDLALPGKAGRDHLSELLRIDSDIAIILFAAAPSMESAIDAFKAGAFDYIPKPFDPAQFGAAIRSVIERKGLLLSRERKTNLQVGARIRDARKDQNLTIKQLAKRTNLSISLISQIERAESAASMATIYKISQALGLTLEKIFEGM